MRISKNILVLVVIFILSGLRFAHGDTSENKSQDKAKAMRVLFIGNSHTYCNNMPLVLVRLAISAKPSIIMHTTQQAPGGCTLERHWQDGKALKLIQQGGWDVVILQENGQIPLRNPKKMHEYAGKFVAEIKKVNARTVLFMTAAHQDMPQATETIAELYRSIGTELDISVAPVGLAFKRSLEKRPYLILHDLSDKVHANERGTYLTACVFYAVLTGQNPDGLSDGRLYTLKPTDMQFLQQMAWETVQNYRQNSKSNSEVQHKNF